MCSFQYMFSSMLTQPVADHELFQFGRLGAHLVLWDIDEEGNEQTARILREEGVRVSLLLTNNTIMFQCTAYTVNLSDRQRVQEVAGQVLREFGDVFLVMNNAGVVVGKPLEQLSGKEVDRTIDVNVKSLFHVSLGTAELEQLDESSCSTTTGVGIFEKFKTVFEPFLNFRLLTLSNFSVHLQFRKSPC